MKNTLNLMLFALLAFGMMACGEKKLTQEDMKEAELSLFGDDGAIKPDMAPKVAEKYCKFVEQNPDDPTASTWLFHAMELNIAMKNADKSIELCDKLLEQYPESKWAPNALLVMGSYLYEDQLNDTAQAHQAYQRLIDDYPDNGLVQNAQVLIECLGMTDEEKLSWIQMSKLEEVEEEW